MPEAKQGGVYMAIKSQVELIKTAICFALGADNQGKSSSSAHVPRVD